MATRKSKALPPAIAIVAIASLALMATPARASGCASFTSADARAQGELRLCQHPVEGVATTFACREYRNADFRYLLLFKGGPLPKAMLRNGLPREVPDPGSAPGTEATRPLCRQSPPPGVPDSATYRGTGVCLDAHDRAVPCSVYEHALARSPHAMRYLVFYDPHGAGATHIDAQVAGDNTNALLAELAFQTGTQLVNSTCCSAQAQGYFAYALDLFPDEPDYRAAYDAGLELAPVPYASREHASPTAGTIAPEPELATVPAQDASATTEFGAHRAIPPGVRQPRTVPQGTSP